MNPIRLILFLLIILVAAPASAEFYKYVDEQGNIHFTDDYNKVPLDQRKGIRGYVESQSVESPAPQTAPKEAAPETRAGTTNDSRPVEINEENENKKGNLGENRKRLNALKKDIDQ